MTKSNPITQDPKAQIYRFIVEGFSNTDILEYLEQKNLSIDLFVTYILNDFENESQIIDMAHKINFMLYHTLEEFKESEFYESLNQKYGLNITINTIYANTKVITNHYNTFTKKLNVEFFNSWQSDPDSEYRKLLAKSSNKNWVFIITPDRKNNFTITKPTKDTYVNWRGNTYIQGVPELSEH